MKRQVLTRTPGLVCLVFTQVVACTGGEPDTGGEQDSSVDTTDSGTTGAPVVFRNLQRGNDIDYSGPSDLNGHSCDDVSSLLIGTEADLQASVAAIFEEGVAPFDLSRLSIDWPVEQVLVAHAYCSSLGHNLYLTDLRQNEGDPLAAAYQIRSTNHGGDVLTVTYSLEAIPAGAYAEVVPETTFVDEDAR